jgi:DNA processing protein
MDNSANANLPAKLALWRTPGIGPSRYRRILKRVSEPAELFAWTQAQWLQVGLNEASAMYWLERRYQADVALDIAWLQKSGRHLLCREDARYPQSLLAFADAPPLLFVHGDCDVLQAPQIAMVGTRHPTRDGLRFTHDLAGALVRQKLTVTSGLALGIDGAAHEGAVQANGSTIAVLANGLDRVYPASHLRLAERILASSGALVSEFPIGVLPRKEHFPRRNRIISGLAYGVVVMEAAIKSGSLITARLAGQQGKEVFAVPGAVHNPQSRGCHQLLREGATLVESVDDILAVIYPLMQQQMQLHVADAMVDRPMQTSLNLVKPTSKTSPVEIDLPLELRQVLAVIQPSATSLDEIMQATQLRADVLLTHLMTLELQDCIITVPGGYQRRHG